jgi:hypothetical protein
MQDVKLSTMEHNSYNKKDSRGRNLGIDNDDVRDVLWTILKSEKPPHSKEIVKVIRRNDDKYMSNEYKVIKKLHERKYLAVILRQNDEKTASEIKKEVDLEKEYHQAQREIIQARHDFKLKKISKEELKIKEDKTSEIEKQIDSQFLRKCRYTSTFRGLLHYLYVEYLIDDIANRHSKINYKRKVGRERKQIKKKSKSELDINSIGGHTRIHMVLLNPITLDIAPFLKYYELFEKAGFRVIDILFQISVELHNQLHIDAEGDNYLLRRATERYFVELENHFHLILDSPLSIYHIRESGMDKYNEILKIRNSYREHIIFLQKLWIARQLETLDFIDKQCRSFNITKELHDIIENNVDDSIIQFDGLEQKHFISNSDLLDIIAPQFYDQDRTEPYYYSHKDKEYLVLNQCLIPKSIVDKVKKSLFNGMYLRDTVLLLKKYNIPNVSSQLDVNISKLGFEIMRRGRKWNYYDDPFIVKKTVGNTNNLLEILRVCPEIFFT